MVETSLSPPLVISEEEDDSDGFPLTPPVLDAHSSHSDHDSDRVSPTPIRSTRPNLDCNIDLEGLDVNVLLVDFLCILCQRVCNTAYAVGCSEEHRFCKSCVVPRWHKGNRHCPRCNEKLDTSPQPDPIWDSLIDQFGYDKEKVNYMDLDLNYSSGSDDDYLDMYDCNEEEKEHYKRRKLEAKKTSWRQPPASRLSLNEDEEENVLYQRLKARLKGDPPPSLPSDIGHYPDYRWGNSVRKCNIVPGYKSIIKPEHQYRNTKRPLENMVYKYFKCNEGHEWPNPKAPSPPFGLPRNYRTKLRAAQKTVRGFVNDPYLTKRERKISVHKYLTEDADPKWNFPQYSSSSDDDLPSKRVPRTKFIIPPGYRQRRQEMRRRDTKPEADCADMSCTPGGESAPAGCSGSAARFRDEKKKSEQDSSIKVEKMEMNSPVYESKWGNPLLLIRDNSTKSLVSRRLLRRIYLGAHPNTSVEHLREHVYRKLGQSLHRSDDFIKDKFEVELCEVTLEVNGEAMSILRCDKVNTDHSPSALSGGRVRSVSPVKRGSPKKFGEPQCSAPAPTSASPSNSCQQQMTSSQQSPPRKAPNPATFQIGGKRIIFPFGDSEPTVREVALRTMNRYIKEDKKNGVNDSNTVYRQLAPQLESFNTKSSSGSDDGNRTPGNSFIATESPCSSRSLPNLTTSFAVPFNLEVPKTPTVTNLPAAAISGVPISTPITTLVPVGKAFNTTLQFNRKRLHSQQAGSIRASNDSTEVLQVVQSVDPVSKQITYSQLTQEGKLVRLKGPIVQCGSDSKKKSRHDSNRPAETTNHDHNSDFTVTAQSVKLSSKCTVYSMHYPHRPLSETETLEQVRSRRKLGQFERMTFFFIIKDRKRR